MKSYTDLEQSKKLAKILPLESADMTYVAIVISGESKMIINGWKLKVGLDSAIKENLFSYRNGYVIPCWSLAALLNVLPKIVRLIGKQKDWSCECINNHIVTFSGFGKADNPIDACYKTIIKLKERKLI